MSVEDVLVRLDGVHRGGRPGQYEARCPAHDDRHASLSIGIGRRGQTLIHCHAGCNPNEIVYALGLTLADLTDLTSPEPITAEHAPWHTSNGPSLAAPDPLPTRAQLEVWAEALQRHPHWLQRVHQAKAWRPGTLAALTIGLQGDRLAIPVRHPGGRIANVLRYLPDAPKDVPKMLATRGRSRLPLYALIPDQERVWLVEGETDAISLADIGISAIGVPGASAAAREQWLLPAIDRTVIVCMDNDDAGHRAARRWAAVARKVTSRVRVLELDGPSGYDVSDIRLSYRDDPGACRKHLTQLADRASVAPWAWQ